MKTFKQFLYEMPHDNDMSASKSSLIYGIVVKKPKAKAYIGDPYYDTNDKKIYYQKISSTPTHDFYRKVYHNKRSSKSRGAVFMAVDKKTKRANMEVSGDLHGNKNKKFTVDILSSYRNNTLKAHEFYHHLLHAGHVNELISDTSHSPGARKVWKRLSKMPNIKMGAVKKEIKGRKITFKKDLYNKRIERNYSNEPDSTKYNRMLVAKADIKRGS